MKVSLNPEELPTLLSLFAGAPRRCELARQNEQPCCRSVCSLSAPYRHFMCLSLFVFSVLFISYLLIV